MPTVLRVNGYRFHFYSNEGAEPPHIHVARSDAEAKFWLDPIQLADNDGFASHELLELVRIVREHQAMLLEAYRRFHGL
jgi:hypothetical protein